MMRDGIILLESIASHKNLHHEPKDVASNLFKSRPHEMWLWGGVAAAIHTGNNRQRNNPVDERCDQFRDRNRVCDGVI